MGNLIALYGKKGNAWTYAVQNKILVNRIPYEMKDMEPEVVPSFHNAFEKFLIRL